MKGIFWALVVMFGFGQVAACDVCMSAAVLGGQVACPAAALSAHVQSAHVAVQSARVAVRSAHGAFLQQGIVVQSAPVVVQAGPVVVQAAPQAFLLGAHGGVSVRACGGARAFGVRGRGVVSRTGGLRGLLFGNVVRTR